MKKIALQAIICAVIFWALPCQAQSAGVESGLSWLSSVQNTDGSWGVQTELTLVYSTEAVNALKFTGTGSTNYTAGIAWLNQQAVTSTDELSRQIYSLFSSGIGSSALISTLLSYRNSDGGWSYNNTPASDALDTALALQALKAANYSDATVLYQAITFLTTNQNSDGGWGFYSGNESNVYTTAIVSATLQKFSQTTSIASAINKATSFLIAHQNTDGGFGSSPSTVYETALAYEAVANVITDATVLGSAVNYLTTTQASDGSWGQDPYNTALALKALHLFETRPVTPPPPPAPTTGTVNGTVIDASTNQPISGVSAVLASNTAIAALTNSAGAFSLADIPQGSQQITFSLNGYATSTATVPMMAGSIMNIGSVPLTVVLTTGTIQGTITDASNGSALSGVTIMVTGTTTWTATTSSDGMFKITNITPGSITISATKSGYTAVSAASTVAAGETLIFSPSMAVPPPPVTTGGLKGKVIDSATGLPLQAATISVAGAKSYPASTDSSGNFALSSINIGSYVVSVSAAGYGARTYSVTVIADVTTDLGSIALTLNPTTGTVQGTVTNASTGAPISGAAITVSGPGAGSAVTATDGSYQLTGLNPGTYTLSAAKTGYGTVSDTGTVVAGGTLVFNVSLTSTPPVNTTEIKGVCVDASTGQPISGAVLTFTPSPTGPVATAASDATGAFVVSSATSGKNTISITASGYISQTGTLTIVSNVVNNVGTIQLTPAPASTTITGKVTDAVSGAALSNVDVTLVGTNITTRTDSTGAYTFTNVIAMAFVVKASATGYNSHSYNTTTTSYGAYVVDFALSISQTSVLRITSLVTDKQGYSANENVLITATIENTGSAAISTIIEGQINDNDGNTVALTKPANPNYTGEPYWVITIEPSSSVTVTMLWSTAQFAPGDYKVNLNTTTPSIHGSFYVPGTILAQHGLAISIQPFVGIANSALICDPTFVYTGATAPLTIGLTLANQSNIPADLTIQYDIKSPSGALMQSGTASAALSLDMITTTIPLALLNYTFVETGEYPVHAVVYNGGVKIGDIQTAFIVLDNIRIEPTRTVTPNTLLPNGTGKVTTTIRLSGKGESSTTPNPAPSTINVLSGYKAELFASGLFGPVSIRVNSDDEFYVAESTKDRIVKVSPTGSVSLFENSGPGTPLDFAPGNVYRTKIDVDKNGNLYVGCVGWYDNPYNPSGDTLDTLYKITPDGVISIVARQYVSPNRFYDISSVAVSPDGELYVFIGDTWNPHDILKINLATKTSTMFATSVYNPVDLLFDKAGNLFVCMSGTSTEKLKIYRFAPDGTKTVFNDTIATPVAMAWGPDGLLYVVDATTKAVYTIDPTTKTVTPFATGFTAPYDLDFDSQGNLYVLEYQTGQIIKILSTAAVFTEVRLIDTIPAKNTAFVLSSATTTPYSVTTAGEDTVVEWRLNSVTAGKNRTISFDLNLSNLIPVEDRLVDRSLELIYNDLNNQEVTVDLPSLSVHVLASAFTSTLSTDKSAYQANEDAVVGATITNLSEYARTIDAKVQIEDSSGNLVSEITTLSNLTFNAGEMKNFDNLVFNTGIAYAGDYKAHLVLSENKKQTGEAFADFKIQQATIALSAVSAKATVDKLLYSPRENVTITPVITSLSSNSILENLTAWVRISSPSGVDLASETRGITMLMPEATFSFKSYWNTGAYPAGAYPVTIEVKDAYGILLASGAAEVNIGAITNPKALLKGTVKVDKQSVLAGEPVAVNYDITNAGNVDLTGINLSVQILHVVAQTVYDTLADQASLIMGATYTGSGQITTQNYSAKDYLVILQATINGTTETLSGTYFRVEGAPSAPSLSLPANGSDVETITPALVVNNASDPNDDKLTYEFEVYGETALATLVTATSGVSGQAGGGQSSWSVPVVLVENQTYFWRSRAYDGKLYGDWMSPASFRVNTVNDPPTAPTPASPADSGVVDTLTPVLIVNNASDPDSSSLTYNYDVALDPDFTQIVASKTGVFEGAGAGSTSWQVSSSLVENTTYYWRCQSDDWLIIGPWMTTASFFVNTANDAPAAPVIIAPLNNSEVTTLSPDIAVTNSTDPDSPVLTYFFELDTVPTFDSSGIMRSGSISSGQGTTLWQATGLQDNTLYYVRAKANDGQTDGPWSNVSVFFVNTVNDPPTASILANPSNGAGVNTFTPVLSVHNSTDLDRDVLTYEFEVYGDSALASLVTATGGVSGQVEGVTSWIVPVVLTENATYYWRARAFDGETYSPWMPTASFMVNTANDAPSAPQLSSPAEGSSVATLTPTLAIKNAVDPDSDTLTYDFEIYSNGVLVMGRSGVSSQAGGITSWTVTTALTDNTVYQWRTRAYDGDRYGAWMAMASFTVHVSQSNVNATINFDPNTLNKKSSGNWVTVYIELPTGYKVSDTVVSSIRLEGTIPAELWPYAAGDYDKDGIPDLMVKFKRSDVINLLPNGEHVPVHVTGKVGTVTFEGVDIIRVMK